MATEKLIVLLDAKTTKLDSKLQATDKKLNKLDGSTKKADRSFSQMGKTALIAGTAMAASIIATTRAAVVFAKELDVAAKRANSTVEEMQSLAFATGTVGVSLEKLGDISKDTNEKIGEFIATGGGGFQDFVDVMKLSSSEANVLAREFQNMSGPDVLQAMTKSMEDAGISGNQMSFALEGLASDATDLIPLLSNNGAELDRLKGKFNDLNVTLSQADVDKIKEVGEAFSALGEMFAAEGRQLIADYGDQLIAAAQAIGALAQTSTDFFNVVTTGWTNIIELGAVALVDLVNGTELFAEALEERTKKSQEAIAKLLGDNNKALEITVTGGTKVIKKGTAEEKASLDQRIKNFSNYTKAAAVVNAAFLDDNKAIKAGLIVADTAAAVMMQLSSGDPYTAFGRAALAAAMGAAQLSNALSSSKGGGSVSNGESSSGSSSQPAQQDFQEETSSLDLTSSSEGGSQSFNLTVPDGDEIGQAIANWLNQAKAEGRN